MAAETLKRPPCPPHLPLGQRLAYYSDRSGGPNACWTWTGYREPTGYGRLQWKDRSWRAHRVAWIVENGPIPPDKPHILHHCDHPPCCNPAHLWNGTHQENMADREAKRRNVPLRGIRNGRAKLTENDVLTIRDMKGRAPVKEIAVRYGVHKGTVYKILYGNRWRHVP